MQLESLLERHERLVERDYTKFDHSILMPRHCWYSFKEGFSPLLVEEAINSVQLKEDDLIVDPFAGSGTVSVVANTKGYRSLSFEVNPFMAFIADTKQINMEDHQFLQSKERIIRGIQNGAESPLQSFSTFSKSDKLRKWLFNSDVLNAFEGGWQSTNALPSAKKKLYQLALVSSVMENANAIKDGKCLRYKKGWETLAYSVETFLTSFEEKCNTIAKDLNTATFNNQADIVEGDARVNLDSVSCEPFRLCITSPPYLNSFDYSDIYRPELFLCKFVQNNTDLRALRLKTLRSHIQVLWPEPTTNDFGMVYENCFNELIKRKDLLWNHRIPLMVQAYFEDMENILKKLMRLAHKDASLWLVVSTSAYAGVEIPVDLITADIGSKMGWNLEEVIVTRYLRNSTQNAQKWNNGESSSKRLRESIVIFKGFRR